MARLINLSTKKVVYLLSYHSFGRLADNVDTFLNAPVISNIHASIEWDGEGWMLKDMSRNGTWLNGQKLEKFESRCISLNSEIRFTASGDESWIVDSLAPPSPILFLSESPQKYLELDFCHLLPDEKNPEIVISQDQNTLSWKLHTISESTADDNFKLLEHGDVIRIHDQDWITFFPEPHAVTKDLKSDLLRLNDYQMTLLVSLDEENIGITLSCNKYKVELGYKSHHYLLLYLARKSLEDNAKGLVENDRGWVDNSILVKELGIEETHINIHIFRIRKDFSKQFKFICDHQNIINRRRGCTRIGVQASNIKIIKGSEVFSG